MKRALITGATGFVGSHICRHIAGAGWSVDTVGHLDTHAQYVALIGMLEKKPDVVFHLATKFVGTHREGDVCGLIDSNLRFGTQLLEAMSRACVKRIVSAGTVWQHPRPCNLYAATKQAFEAIAGYYVDAHGIQHTTLTMADTYGPGDTRPKLVNAMKAAARTGDRMKMLPPNHMMDLVHVDDVCRAFVAGADLASGRWSVAGTPVRLETVVKEFERAAGVKINVGWGERQYAPREAREPWIGEILPGWEPRVTLREGMTGLFP